MTKNVAELVKAVEDKEHSTINELALLIAYTARTQDNHRFSTQDGGTEIYTEWDDENDVPAHIAGFPSDGQPMTFNINFDESGESVTGVYLGDDKMGTEAAIDLLTLFASDAKRIVEQLEAAS